MCVLKFVVERVHCLQRHVAWANFTQTNSDFNCLFFCFLANCALKASFGNVYMSNTFSAFSSLVWHLLPTFLFISPLNSSLPQLVFPHLLLFLPRPFTYPICFSFLFLTITLLHLLFFTLASTLPLFTSLSDFHLPLQHTFTHLQFASSVSPVEFSQLPFPFSVPTYHRAHNNTVLWLCECMCVRRNISVCGVPVCRMETLIQVDTVPAFASGSYQSFELIGHWKL